MKNILFIRLRLLGDIIFTIPALELYKKKFPDSKIYYVAEEKFREIAMLIPGIHEVIVLPRKMTLKQHVRFRKKIKNLGIDTVVDFHSGPKSALLTRFTGAKTRIGYKTPNRNYAYTHKTPRTFGDGPTHSVFNQVKLLEHLGVTGITAEDIPGCPPILPDESQISAEVKKILREHQTHKKAVIHVGAGNRFRDWGIENFSILIKQLIQDKVSVFLVGKGKEEKEKGEYLSERYDLHDFTGRLSIAETLFLISQSTVYCGVDSGPLHLASLTATPLVALYGPNIPEISGPWRKTGVTIVQLPLKCRPCSQRTCIYDTIRCMINIKTDVVYEAIHRYLK
ncbi:MAG: glycosyltransferase family 9 protein [bacterium]|nr:glycosyltransferase family 9 protein [bacterium]